MKKITVWDWPVRLGHWLLVVAFATAWLSGESEAWRLVHVFAGGTLAGILLFRVLWGIVGTRHARFASFVRAPATVLAYLRSLRDDSPAHYTGHNPAGGWAIVLLMLLGLMSAMTGWLAYQEIGGEWLEETHELLTNGMLLVVIVHVAGVIVSSRLHRENLVQAMFSGQKLGAADEAITSTRIIAVPVLLAMAIAGAWLLSR